MQLLLEHVKDKLALHCILDKLILTDVAVSLFINSIPVVWEMCKMSNKSIITNDNLMSETQTVTKSSSSSIPANLYSYNLPFMSSTTKIFDPKPEESDDDIPDLIHVDAAASVSVERCEDPVELVLGGVELVHAVSL